MNASVMTSVKPPESIDWRSASPSIAPAVVIAPMAFALWCPEWVEGAPTPSWDWV